MSLDGWYAARTHRPATVAGKKEREHTVSDIISAPAPSGGITWADHSGALFIITPLSIEEGIQTSFGTAKAVRADVVILTGPGEAEEYPDTLVFPKVLAGQLGRNIGKKVVGRLGQGNAKPGQSAPWVLDAATPDDLEKAQAWLAKAAPAVIPAQAAAPF